MIPHLLPMLAVVSYGSLVLRFLFAILSTYSPCSLDITMPPHPITLLFVYLVGLASRSACLDCYLYLLVITCIFKALISDYLVIGCGTIVILMLRRRRKASVGVLFC